MAYTSIYADPQKKRASYREPPPRAGGGQASDEERRGVQWLSLGLGLAGAATIGFAFLIPALGPASATYTYLLISGGLYPVVGLAWFLIWPQVLWPDKPNAAFSRLIVFASAFACGQLAWWIRGEYFIASIALVPAMLTLIGLGVTWRPHSDVTAVWMWRVFYLLPAFVAILCVLWLAMPWPKPVVEARQIMNGDWSGGIRGIGRWLLTHVLHLSM